MGFCLTKVRGRMTNAHKEKKRCTCGECGGIETIDYYLVAGQPVATECYERNQRRANRSNLSATTDPIRRNEKRME